MFDQLSEKLSHAFKAMRGHTTLTESNIQDTIQEIRKALLNADVALEVTDTLLDSITQKALGQEVMASLDPAQAFIKIVNQELISLMGEACERLDLNATPPAVVLVAGLQGAGKTTTVAKIAKWLKEKQNKKVMVTSTDIHRPAAIDQLETLAQQVDVTFFPSTTADQPAVIAQNAIKQAAIQMIDVVIIDTAGRLHIDEAMMDEVAQVHKQADPTETLFVVDSMTGQDAANTAKAFHDKLPLTGVILTKMDGDARGGAALSVKYITGKPIKFLGTGEKIDALEAFHPDRIASRILGMGDILTLIEEAEQKVDRKKTEKLAKKFKKNQDFDLEDFRDQLIQMQNMGGMGSILSKLPGMGQLPPQIANQIDDSKFKRLGVIIDSMTKKERRFPKIINGSRKKRIAAGSGTSVQEINSLLKQHLQMQKMMKKMRGGNMMRMMQQFKGKMPPGFPM